MSTQDYINQIWLIVTTAPGGNCGTKAGLQLQVALPGEDVLLDTAPVSTESQTLNAPGHSAEFTWTPSTEGAYGWAGAPFTAAQIGRLELEIVGTSSGDAWLPSSIWVLTRSDVSGYQVLSASPIWPSNAWFSTQEGDHDSAWQYALPLTARTIAAGTVAVGTIPVVGEPAPSAAG